jgi:hypothetical protein
MPETKTTAATPEAISPADAMRLMHTVRDRLIDAAANAYAEHLKDARLDLQQLADRAADATRRELYEAGHALLANGGLGMMRRFRDTYCRACDRAIGLLRGTESDAWEGVEELSLVDATVFERDLAIARLSAKAAYACSQQLTALDRRVAALLGLRRMDAEGNPFGVKRLFNAFVDAAEANWSGAQLSLTLLETFEHYTAERLPEIYRELNQYLVDNGVLPKLPVEIDEREHELDRPHRGGGDAVGDVFVQLTSGLIGGRAAAGGWGAGAPGAGVPGGYPPGGYSPGARPQGGAAAGPMGGVAPSPGGGHDPTGGQMAPMVLSQLIDGLTGLQRGSDDAAAKLGIDADAVGDEGSALLRSLGSSPLLRWLQPNDAVTIELVAMLFDCIFSDAEVPESLRETIGRLQVPVLKVALMNKGFFSDRRHPARRLLDVMAAAARGWGSQDEQALLARIRAAVDNVLAGFDQDTSVFDAEVMEIEGILRDAERAARGQVGELVQRLEQRDRGAVADAVVADQIDRRLNETGPAPAAVAAFVDTHWRELLKRLYVRFGDGGEDWRDALSTLDDLLWSVQPKATPEDRQRLKQLLPELLARLPAGLARIGRAAIWEPFLSELMPLHMAAIRTPPPQAASDPVSVPDEPVGSADAAASAVAQAPPDSAAQAVPPPDSEGLPWMLDSEPSAPQESTPAAPDSAAPEAPPASAPVSSAPPHEPEAADVASQDPWLEAAHGVAVGDWLEVAQLGGASLSLRATWLSRQSGLMLFADRRGRNARVLSAERLAAALRDGTARLLSRDPLTDRAVARLLVSAAPSEQTAA